jgi:hypothetical protein
MPRKGPTLPTTLKVLTYKHTHTRTHIKLGVQMQSLSNAPQLNQLISDKHARVNVWERPARGEPANQPG